MGLFVGGNGIKDSGATELAKVISENTLIQELDLRGCRPLRFDNAENNLGDRSATEVSAALHRGTSLRVLNISKNEIGPSGAKAIAGVLALHKSMTTLKTDGNKFGEAGATALMTYLGAERLKAHDVDWFRENDIDDSAALVMARWLKLRVEVLKVDVSS